MSVWDTRMRRRVRSVNVSEESISAVGKVGDVVIASTGGFIFSLHSQSRQGSLFRMDELAVSDVSCPGVDVVTFVRFCVIDGLVHLPLPNDAGVTQRGPKSHAQVAGVNVSSRLVERTYEADKGCGFKSMSCVTRKEWSCPSSPKARASSSATKVVPWWPNMRTEDAWFGKRTKLSSQSGGHETLCFVEERSTS